MRTKNGRAHTVPLSTAAQSALERHPRVKNPAGYVFCTNGDCHEGTRRAGRDTALDLPRPAPHPRHRHGAAGAAGARGGGGVEPRQRLACGRGRIYNRHAYDDEKRAAMEAWGGFVTGLAEGEAENVVRLEAAR